MATQGAYIAYQKVLIPDTCRYVGHRQLHIIGLPFFPCNQRRFFVPRVLLHQQTVRSLLAHIIKRTAGVYNRGTRAQPHRRKAQSCGGKDSGDGGHGHNYACICCGALYQFPPLCSSVDGILLRVSCIFVADGAKNGLQGRILVLLVVFCAFFPVSQFFTLQLSTGTGFDFIHQSFHLGRKLGNTHSIEVKVQLLSFTISREYYERRLG